MMTSNMPSRAEISDIYNNLINGASGMVLAAEVAVGKNPVSSTALLRYIIKLFENDYQKRSLDSIDKPDVKLIGKELHNWL